MRVLIILGKSYACYTSVPVTDLVYDRSLHLQVAEDCTETSVDT